jgi:hypothetical protein
MTMPITVAVAIASGGVLAAAIMKRKRLVVLLYCCIESWSRSFVANGSATINEYFEVFRKEM